MSDSRKMFSIMCEAHNGQVDKAGVPYYLHPLAVMDLLSFEYKEDDIISIALGHDLFEDTDITPEILREQGFSERVIDGITALTKIKGESYSDYKERVKSNRDAIIVKIADLKHNIDLGRLVFVGITDRDIIRAYKYIEFRKELEELL